jgi:hypothetical protein
MVYLESSYLIYCTIPNYVISRNRSIVDKCRGNVCTIKSYINWILYVRLYARYIYIIIYVGYMQGICRVYIEDPTCLNANNIQVYYYIIVKIVTIPYISIRS